MMEKYRSKNFIIMLFVFIILVQFVFPLVSASTKLLCLQKGQSIRFSLCNPIIPDRTCNADTGCNFCVTNPSSNVYCPANINECNAISAQCTYLSSGGSGNNNGGVTTSNSTSTTGNNNQSNQNNNHNNSSSNNNNQNGQNSSQTNSNSNTVTTGNNQVLTTSSSNTVSNNSNNVNVGGSITAGIIKNGEKSNSSEQTSLDKTSQNGITGKTIDGSNEKILFCIFLLLITLVELGVLIYLLKLSKKFDNVDDSKEVNDQLNKEIKEDLKKEVKSKRKVVKKKKSGV